VLIRHRDVLGFHVDPFLQGMLHCVVAGSGGSCRFDARIGRGWLLDLRRLLVRWFRSYLHKVRNLFLALYWHAFRSLRCRCQAGRLPVERQAFACQPVRLVVTDWEGSAEFFSSLDF
jgi:hypothetical protein